LLDEAVVPAARGHRVLRAQKIGRHQAVERRDDARADDLECVGAHDV